MAATNVVAADDLVCALAGAVIGFLQQVGESSQVKRQPLAVGGASRGLFDDQLHRVAGQW